MNKPITVNILVTVNDPAHFDACTLALKSLRIGWPTAQIYVDINGTAYANETADRIACNPVFAAASKGAQIDVLMKEIHHAEWIRRCIQHHSSLIGPLVFADPDTVFWKSCEDWEFPSSVLLAGYRNPTMWNDFAKCTSQPRIHTSMMVFPDVAKLWEAIINAYPLANMRHGDYCPCDPFMPAVRFVAGKPMFWDSCANLFGMLAHVGRDTVFFFNEHHKACYDHLNSASFYEVMTQRMEGQNREGFIRAHRDWVANPVPGLWPLVDAYYEQKRIEGAVSL